MEGLEKQTHTLETDIEPLDLLGKILDWNISLL